MKILNEQENPQMQLLNEMIVNVDRHLPNDVEQSIYYPKLKHLLHAEIINFCKEKLELKQDLNLLRMSVGKVMSENEIREYLDSLKEKYNSDNIFKSRSIETKNLTTQETLQENLEVIVYTKNKWYKNIFRKILDFIKWNK